eukprot:724949-Ditylum_brightwellii.AAC.1
MKESWVIEDLPKDLEQPKHPAQPTPAEDQRLLNNKLPEKRDNTSGSDKLPPFVGNPNANSLPSWGSGLHKNILHDDSQSMGTAVAFDNNFNAGISAACSATGSVGVSQITSDSQMSAMEATLAHKRQKLTKIHNTMADLVTLTGKMKDALLQTALSEVKEGDNNTGWKGGKGGKDAESTGHEPGGPQK